MLTTSRSVTRRLSLRGPASKKWACRSGSRSARRARGRRKQKKRLALALLRQREQAEKRRWRKALLARADESARVTKALEAAADEEFEGRGSWLPTCRAAAERAPSLWAERASWYRDLIASWTGAAPFVWPAGTAVAASSLPFLSPAGSFQPGITVEGATEDEALAALCEAVCSLYSADAPGADAESWEGRILTALAAQHAARWHYRSCPPPTRIDLRAAYATPSSGEGALLCAAHEARFCLSFDQPHLPALLQQARGQVRLQVLILELESGAGRHTYVPISFSERLLSLDPAMFALGAPASRKEFFR